MTFSDQGKRFVFAGQILRVAEGRVEVNRNVAFQTSSVSNACASRYDVHRTRSRMTFLCLDHAGCFSCCP